MINGEQRSLLHQYLLLDLAVKSLQQDYKRAEYFKMKLVFLPLMDALLKNLRKDYFQVKALASPSANTSSGLALHR